MKSRGRCGARRQTRIALEVMTLHEADCIAGIQASTGCMPADAIRAHRRFVAELYAGLTTHAARAIACHVERTYEVDGRLYLSLN